jgi:hypothetical protein
MKTQFKNIKTQTFQKRFLLCTPLHPELKAKCKTPSGSHPYNRSTGKKSNKQIFRKNAKTPKNLGIQTMKSVDTVKAKPLL